MACSSRHFQVRRLPTILCLRNITNRAAEMSQQQPQLYNNLTTALGPEEQQVIKAAIDQADKLAAEQQQAAATRQGANATRPGAEGVHTQSNGTN